MADTPRWHEYDALHGDAVTPDFLRFPAESATANWDAACLGPLYCAGVVGGAMI